MERNMKVLVTGAGGFVGEYLVKLLKAHNHDIVAIGINNGTFLKELSIPTHVVNILDYPVLRETMQNVVPDAVIHLAAVSNVPISWNKPGLTIDVNIHGTVNVLQALYEVNPKAKFLNIGSSDEYGLTAKCGKTLTEDMPCQPQNPYSISKYCTEQMVLQLGKKYGMNVISTRSFNHFGPGQAKGFVVSDFASQIKAIEAGEQEPVIRVGDLSAARDFTFVSDVVEAYVSLIEKDVESGVYNVCSGKAMTVQEILDMMLHLSSKEIKVELDEGKFRPSEVPFFVGCADKLSNATGWKVSTDIVDGLKNILKLK
jgi:GDP-4-dehydro-6-deoxy-D-mannose reductase